MGEFRCLSVSDGDIKISFDTANDAEAIRAGRMIKDMLRRGYVLLVQTRGKKYIRATDFDEKKGEYIIADVGNTFEVEIEETETVEVPKKQEKNVTTKKTEAKITVKQKGKRREGRIPMESTRTVSVAPTAGG